MEVVNLTVTFGIAVYFQRFFTKRQNDQRIEKDLVIELIVELETSLKSCRDAVQASTDGGKVTVANRKAITFELRQMSNGLESVKDLIGLCKFSDLDQLKNCADLLDSKYFDFKKAVTGGGYPNKPYDSGAIADFHRTLRELRRQIHVLVLAVNRAS